MPTTSEIAIPIPRGILLLVFFSFQGELFEVLEDDKCLPEEQVQAMAIQLVLFYHSESSDALISKRILHNCQLSIISGKGIALLAIKSHYSSRYETIKHPYWPCICC